MLARSLWLLVGVAAACLTATAFIPQIILRLRNPAQARISTGTLVTFLLGASLWVGYGIHLGDWVIILANLFVISTLLILAGLQLWRPPR